MAVLTPRACPACASNASRTAGEKNGYPLVTCRECATLFVAALPSAETLHDVYARYYQAGNLSVPAFIAGRLDETVAAFASYRTTGALLDVGFGAGTLLEAARRRGWTAQGVEVSEPAIRQAVARGFDVVHGTLTDAKYPSGSFDVVTAVEVLEHLTDPVALLVEIARILRPGGLLWATTPHGRGLSARGLGSRWSVVSPPDHIQLFSVTGIRALLRQAGLAPIRIATEGVNPFELAHAIFRRKSSFKRVESSYRLNAFLSDRPSRRAVKSALNGLLSAAGMGDSLKVFAVTDNPVQKG